MTARNTNSLLICLISILSATTGASSQHHGDVINRAAFVLKNAPSNQLVFPNDSYTSQPITTPTPTQNHHPRPQKFSETAPHWQHRPKRPSVAANVFDLSKKILTAVLENNKQSKYLVVSPTSISSALSLALVGARGKTFQELQTTLQFPVTDNMCEVHEQFGKLLTDLVATNEWQEKVVTDTPVNAEPNDDEDFDNDEDFEEGPREHKISVANALFVQHDFQILNDYKKAIQNVYKANVYDVNYMEAPAAAADFINGWVTNATNGKIKQIVSNTNLGSETKMIIASALYFKAEWRKMFIEGANMIRPFYPNGKEEPSYSVEMMAHGGLFPFYQSEEFDCRIIGFTYAHGESMMYVIMPNNSNRAKLRQLQERLNADKIEDMINQMKNSTSVILFPKLTLSTEVHLKQVLQQTFGLNALFNLRQSDLSLISDGYGRVITYSGPTNYKPKRVQRDVKYKVESSVRRTSEPLNLKDFVLHKRISKKNPGKKSFRSRRQTNTGCQSSSLNTIDMQRRQELPNPSLYADEILHKVELSINERGTEGGAATAITLNRSGTKVVFRADGPFLLLIRHELTKLPLFYGAVFEPPSVQSP